MSHLLDHVGDRPLRACGDGEVLIAEGATDTPLFVLAEGRLVVEREGQRIAVVDQPGAVLGEISMLLGVPATATVRAVGQASVRVVDADDVLQIRVHDDGRGGADQRAGTGLAGIAARVRGADGSLDISSPKGGPTVIDVRIPHG